ncbi:transcriptional regulator [Salmonella enterica]|uniref:Transcriptional regulator n=1 Tax=Salmonella enterica TaxID=28901 RepID=A0A5T4LPB1_SALER|nr:transcriptional regulator [Salmonella enterica]EBC6662449.1 transcriptional regulator [Salmonella enterica]EBL7518566.1 transcriptional regulator [Salmonella enterica]EDC7605814.1 transcriptional regulator [Salmonella enterica subsp. enterica serovar Newport]EJW0033273.1 transcriptional regulator [Salmonella enterica]
MSKVRFNSKSFKKNKDKKMNKELFELLCLICVMHSYKMKNALEDYCVTGFSRKEACRRNNVFLSNFSLKLKHLHNTLEVVNKIKKIATEES